VQELFEKYGDDLGFLLVTKNSDISGVIKAPEIHRPGLALSGHFNDHEEKRLLVFGRAEIEYLRKLDEYLRKLDDKTRLKRLSGVISKKNLAVIITRRYRAPQELIDLCNERDIPLFRTKLKTMNLMSRLTVILADELSPKLSMHGTLVEVFGLGTLILGDSSVGKSEAALGLIERGHRLISDDLVQLRKREGSYIEGFGTDLSRHILEIRGIGIINVAHLYGAVCVSERMRIDLIIQLEEWDENHFYDRVGLEEKYKEIHDIQVPFHTLPVKPGRDVVLLIETTVLNHRLKKMGYNSAKEFNMKLLQAIAKRRSVLK